MIYVDFSHKGEMRKKYILREGSQYVKGSLTLRIRQWLCGVLAK